ncbi:hypothetical protein ASF99_07710 [Exiguobacterium sp. Leaf187]|uniref:DUF86 domain-containing protein n=3 Tax=Bacteria TaxID=2 RepID=A0A725BA84_SALEP|nr:MULTISPECIES: DUF86 domain-containing protein [Exiguobacterium]HAE0521266.1 DUF86 domain-containing protein [Salmonella enterica subsp. enterica serovar Enteritidis str. P125109]AHA30529.1 hypothetical protein U719_12810 [Exiguobacterium sp. MH3]KQS19762.1 hypothetical protein ASF99_07710 [Exiguobacterium sp. Leaf187]KSU50229.1 hypothetical protein AS033_02300 [Exiguobacterium enclense]KTR26114.1 hypothetical protein RSA11_12015 [Exiguobacterium indicum]
MYFVNRQKIEETVVCYETALRQSKEVTGDPVTTALAMERIGFLVIESVIDIGNSMIDGFIMRDPGSYEDIILILEDEKVIDGPLATSLKKLVALRTLIVRSFTQSSMAEIRAVLETEEAELRRFPEAIRRYIETELGPVSAFLPNEE